MSTPRMVRRVRTSGPRVPNPKRRARGHHRPWRIPLVATLSVVAVLTVATLMVLAVQANPDASGAAATQLPSVASASATDSVDASSSASSDASETMDVEVPVVVGKSLASAETILQVAGFTTVTRVDTSIAPTGTMPVVRSQDPYQGALMRRGGVVTLTYSAPASKPAALPTGISGKVVVIDPGHQGKGDSTPEPIGPGSSTTKASVTDGATGATMHVRESVVNLQVAKLLRTKLTAAGITVIMVRTVENVDIANSQRAKLANDKHANLFIRIHCDDVSSTSVHGFLTLVPGKNTWTGPIVSRSALAGRLIHAACVRSTGAYDRGITPRTDMSGFNWSTVPSVIVEMGVMSNPAEDRKLSDPTYQDKLASGMTTGIVQYLGGAK